ncbi:MAG: hypothetical protein U5K30_02785 [Acidimicrobiales bacterium]|nr:hypothetical protein [Acidimicrobiales bacterium]
MPPLTDQIPLLTEPKLQEVHEALRAGKYVGLDPRGRVYVSDESVGPPMEAGDERFVEAKLGELRALLADGWNVSIQPDGTIQGSGPRHQLQKYLAAPDPAVDHQDAELIRAAIRDGQQVEVHPDGTVVLARDPHYSSTPVDEARADRVVAQFDEEVASGQLREHLVSGQALSIESEGTVGYASASAVVRASEPISFPGTGEGRTEGEAGGQPANEPDGSTPTSTELVERRVAAVEADAEALHERANAKGQEAIGLSEARDRIEREHSAMVARQKAEAEVAAKDATRAREQRATVAQERQQAAEARARGDARAAEEAEERAEFMELAADAYEARAQRATAEAERLQGEADTLAEDLEQARTAFEEASEQFVEWDGAADRLDDQARLLREALELHRQADEFEPVAVDGGDEVTGVASDVRQIDEEDTAAPDAVTGGFEATSEPNEEELDLDDLVEPENDPLDLDHLAEPENDPLDLDHLAEPENDPLDLDHLIEPENDPLDLDDPSLSEPDTAIEPFDDPDPATTETDPTVEPIDGI